MTVIECVEAKVKEKRGDTIYTKSGMMLGLGEREEEVLAAMEDLRAAGCDILTLGQYLAADVEAFAGDGICFAGEDLRNINVRAGKWDLFMLRAGRWCEVRITRMNSARRRKADALTSNLDEPPDPSCRESPPYCPNGLRWMNR